MEYIFGFIITLIILIISTLCNLVIQPCLYSDKAYTGGHSKFNHENKNLSKIKQVVDGLSHNMSTGLKRIYGKLFTKKYLDPPSKPIRIFEDIPHQLPYETNTKIYKPSVHIGQRKLHNTEVSFLTTNVDPNNEVIVVYAGAAPSNHTGFLAQLFPNIKFILVDPNPFDIFEANPVILRHVDGPNIDLKLAKKLIKKAIEGSDQIYIINDMFTMHLAKAISELISKNKLFFISDIRTNVSSGEQNPDALDILWNLSQQYNWMSVMKPNMSMLKFRHPFYEEDPEIFEKHCIRSPYKEDFEMSKQLGIDFIGNKRKNKLIYWDGEIHLQSFPGVTSTETRLITSAKALKDFGSHHEYENKMFYYNSIERCYTLHNNDNADFKLGFDHCNDCALENLYWTEYLKKYAKFVRPGTTVKSLVKKLSDITNRPLIRDDHGKFFGQNPNVLIQKINLYNKSK